MIRKYSMVSALFGFLGGFGDAQAATAIAIVNPGFESPAVVSSRNGALGWVVTGSGAGVWNINATPSSPVCSPCWTASAPEGSQIAYIASAPLPGAPAALSQTLSDSLQPGTVYALSGWVGHPIHHGLAATPDTVFSVDLLAGGNTLASLSGTGPEGSLQPFQVVFDSAGSSWLGLPLQIRLSSSQPQTGFDAIRLEASAVPIPAAAWLLGSALAGLGLIGRRGGPA